MPRTETLGEFEQSVLLAIAHLIQANEDVYGVSVRQVIERLAAAAPASGATASIVADLHIAFGTYAMRQGDRREAVRRLTMATTAAATAPAQADSVTGISAGATRLTHDLLTAGERESVAAFYDAVSKNVEPWQRRVFEDAAAAIRAGRMPREYQSYLAHMR